MASLTSTSYMGRTALASDKQHSRSVIAHCGSSCRQRAALRLSRTHGQKQACLSRRPCGGLKTHAMMDEGELVPDVDEGTKVKITKEVSTQRDSSKVGAP